uniref:endonuclease n=1 Tax=uncultured Marinobacter sp. TaxID=187379 RepID=UPI0030DC1E15
MFITRTLLLLLVWGYALVAVGQPANFSQAKVLLKEQVYYDQNQSAQGTLYCGCQWQWTGASGGRADLAGCDYGVRRQQARAERIEWEHIVPAWVMGHQRQCWQNGGREHCVAD